MTKKGTYSIDCTAVSKPSIKLYGYIGGGDDSTDFKQFAHEFASLLAEQGNDITMRMNCYGGSVFEGLAIYDTIINSNAKLTTLVEGVAASMGFIILLAADKRQMTRNSRVMIHKASGAIGGDADSIKAYAEMLEQEGAKLRSIIIERTGQTEAVVDSWLKPGVDTWLTAQDCLKYGICDEIVDGATAALPKSLFKSKNVEELVEVYNALLIPDKTFENDKMKKVFITAMAAKIPAMAALKEDSADNDFVAAVTAALDAKDAEITQLTDELLSHKNATVTAALDGAVADGKIVVADRPNWEKMLNNDFEAASAVLNSMAGRIDINKHIGRKQGAGDDARADWTCDDWEQKDPKGLAAMVKTDPTKFTAIMKTKYPEYAGPKA